MRDVLRFFLITFIAVAVYGSRRQPEKGPGSNTKDLSRKGQKKQTGEER
jgi:hypothetical protein